MAIKSKKTKLTAEERRKLRIRNKLRETCERPRISIFRSSKHTYAQIVGLDGKTVVSASTLDKEVRDEVQSLLKTTEAEKLRNQVQSTKSVNSARAVGIVLARRAKQKSVASVVFDRGGFLYAGRVAAVADGAREGGLDF